MNARYSLGYKFRRALAMPNRIFPYIKRKLRSRLLLASSANFIEFYGRIVDDDATRQGPDIAIGSYTSEHWAETGKFQFDYLVSHGLKSSDRLLDIGCGNLRLGVHAIKYLEPSKYYGIDISAKIVASALRKISDYNLAGNTPYIYLVQETDYSFLPANYFDWVQAHSVFSHLPIEEIEKVLRETYRVMKSGGQFHFTYFPAADKGGEFLKVDFYYSRAALIDAATKYGFRAEFMTDWDYIQHKICAIKP